jgi:hypothetical protein
MWNLMEVRWAVFELFYAYKNTDKPILWNASQVYKSARIQQLYTMAYPELFNIWVMCFLIPSQKSYHTRFFD